jgi:hypothetical protein
LADFERASERSAWRLRSACARAAADAVLRCGPIDAFSDTTRVGLCVAAQLDPCVIDRRRWCHDRRADEHRFFTTATILL